MASVQDNRNGKRKDKNKNRTMVGFIFAAIILLIFSLSGAVGSIPKLSDASAQIATGQPMNTTGQQEQNQTSDASPFSEALERLREQARMHAQQQASMNITDDDRQKAREVSHAIDGVLIYYARALGERNIERINITDPNASVLNVRIPDVPLTAPDMENGANIVSRADYLIAVALAIKAIESFAEVSASAAVTADPVTMQQLADTQEGLSLLLGMLKSKVTYNFVEDVVSSPIKNNLEHIFGTNTATVT